MVRHFSKPKGVSVVVFFGAWTAWTLFMSALIAFDEKIPFVYSLWCNIVLFGLASLLSLPVMGLATWLAARRRVLLGVLVAVVVSFVTAFTWVWLSYGAFRGMYGPLFTENLFDPRDGWIFLTGIVAVLLA